MKVLCCASYHGSGSSAITDLLSEYSNTKPATDFEFTFLYEPDGVLSLEYNLIENFNRVNATVAIKRFYKAAKVNNGDFLHKETYKRYFKGKYLPLTKQYLDSLVYVKYQGYTDYDLRAKGKLKYIWLTIWRKIFNKLGARRGGVMKKEYTYCAYPSENEFLTATRKYVEQLLTIYNDDNKEYVILDQLFSATNIEKLCRYVPFETKVILVNRDPRDIYIGLRYVLKKETYPPSGKDVEEFCRWFEFSHHKASEEASKCDIVKEIFFEDLIFNYEKTVSMVESFTGLRKEDHVAKFSHLNPKYSVRNTESWKKYPEEKENIEYIEKRLAKYLYNFKGGEVVGIDVK